MPQIFVCIVFLKISILAVVWLFYFMLMCFACLHLQEPLLFVDNYDFIIS